MKGGFCNALVISQYKTKYDVVAQVTPPHNGSTYPQCHPYKNKLPLIAYENCYSQTLCLMKVYIACFELSQ